MDNEWKGSFVSGSLPQGQFAFVCCDNYGKIHKGDLVGLEHRPPHQGDVVLIDTPEGPRITKWNDGMVVLAVVISYTSNILE